MKWFELLREEYDCPVVMLHTPYQGDGEITDNMRRYMVEQLEREVIPALEELTGRPYDEDRLKEAMRLSARAEDDMVHVLESAKHRPSPIDAYFGGVYYIGPMFTAFRGTPGAVDYYAQLRREVDARVAAGEGPITPEGPMGEQRYRLVVEGPPNWTNFRELWGMFHEEGAVVVASSYTKVGGVYDLVADPGEQRDLANDRAAVIAQAETILREECDDNKVFPLRIPGILEPESK